MATERPRIRTFRVAPDDEILDRCGTCGKGFPPGSEGLEYSTGRDHDEAVVMFHYGCEP